MSNDAIIQTRVLQFQKAYVLELERQEEFRAVSEQKTQQDTTAAKAEPPKKRARAR